MLSIEFWSESAPLVKARRHNSRESILSFFGWKVFEPQFVLEKSGEFHERFVRFLAPSRPRHVRWGSVGMVRSEEFLEGGGARGLYSFALVEGWSDLSKELPGLVVAFCPMMVE